ncbi:hypothetical protein C8F04DRAFT_1324148 [Mycena alexandri]|uniref:Uncharacterized protein n=1 Tax=Mycena alexandri TaxID=1745969 RepID=A0AAD6WM00_9AGAR|nr:hypothetical protein C8F04DRAFT_1324148 [Mycena alexandri]
MCRWGFGGVFWGGLRVESSRGGGGVRTGLRGVRYRGEVLMHHALHRDTRRGVCVRGAGLDVCLCRDPRGCVPGTSGEVDLIGLIARASLLGSAAGAVPAGDDVCWMGRGVEHPCVLGSPLVEMLCQVHKRTRVGSVCERAGSSSRGAVVCAAVPDDQEDVGRGAPLLGCNTSRARDGECVLAKMSARRARDGCGGSSRRCAHGHDVSVGRGSRLISCGAGGVRGTSDSACSRVCAGICVPARENRSQRRLTSFKSIFGHLCLRINILCLTRLICEAAADAIIDGETPDHPAEETSSALPFDVLGLSVASGAGVKANERLFDASVMRRL